MQLTCRALLRGCLVAVVTSQAAMAAPAAPVPAVAVETTDIREIEALDQKTLDQAEATFFEGLGHYRANRFEEAALAFQRAYTLSHHRDMLFNVARSREKLGDVQGAVSWYRAYLATKPADETAVIHRLKQLGAEPVVAAPTAPKAVEGPMTTVEQGAGPWPWVAAGVAVAAAGAGTVLGFSALGDADAARKAELRDVAKKHKSAAESSALTADLCFGASALAAGAAVFLWWRADAASAVPGGEIQVGALPGGGALGYSAHF